MLMKTACVTKLVVPVNKIDEVTVNWDKARYHKIRDRLTLFIKAADFNPKTDVTSIPVSAYTGFNSKDRLTKSVCPWSE